jgi:signal transduction histidine kinase
VSNAIEHTDPGTRVEINVLRSDNMMTVSVRDRGSGISKDDIEKIFRPFERTGRRKPSGDKSTGLGLTIARKIVEAHRGRIWVESKPGMGSVFSFTIPIHLHANN